MDILRFHLHVPDRSNLIKLGLAIGAVAVLAVAAIQIGRLEIIVVALAVLAYYSMKFDANKYDRHWTVAITPDNITVEAKTGRSHSTFEKVVNVADIKAIEVTKSSRGKPILTIVGRNEGVNFGEGIAGASLDWLKNYLIIEVAGLAWRPLHGVDRSKTKAQSNKVVNPALLNQDLAMRLVDIFNEQAPQFIVKLGEAVEAKDPVAIRQHAHWLKSASANVGAQHMSRLCQVMQIYGMDNNLERADILYGEIRKTHEDVVKWLDDVRSVSATIIAVEGRGGPAGAQASKVADAPSGDAAGAPATEGVPLDDDERIVCDDPMFDATVLVVDDSAVSREIAKNFLEGVVREVVFADDGSSALEVCHENKFDVILTDCEMFGMDGFEFTKELRKLETVRDSERTPVIALTAHALKGDRARCIEAGMDDYMSKPYSIEELHNKIERWTSPEPEPIFGSDSPDVMQDGGDDSTAAADENGEAAGEEADAAPSEAGGEPPQKDPSDDAEPAAGAEAEEILEPSA